MTKKQPILYTIGYESLTLDKFISFLAGKAGGHYQGNRLGQVLFRLHLMKIHMLKDDFSEGLKKIQKENAREIDRLLKVFGKVGEDC